MRNIPGIFGIFIMFCVALSCPKDFEYPITANRISDRIMTYECLDVKVTAVKSEKGLIIIDTEHCPAFMSEIRKHIEKDLNCSTYLYVINTHGHWDHASGNQVFPTINWSSPPISIDSGITLEGTINENVITEPSSATHTLCRLHQKYSQGFFTQTLLGICYSLLYCHTASRAP